MEKYPDRSRPVVQRPVWRQIVGYLLALVFIVVSARFARFDPQRMHRLTGNVSEWLLPVTLIVFSSLLARSLLLRQLSCEAGVPLAWGECFCLLATSNMVGMMTVPATGTVYRATYLSRRHAMPLSCFAAGTSLFALASLPAWSLVGILGLVPSGLCGEDSGGLIHLFLLGILVVVCGAAAIRGVFLIIASGRSSRMQNLAEQCRPVLCSRRLVLSAVVLMPCCAAVQATGFHLVFRSFGLPFTPAGSASVAAFHQVSGMIGITPGAMGVQEGSALLVSSAFGKASAEMVAVLSFLRVSRTGLAILIGAPCWCFLRRFPRPTEMCR